MQLLRIAIVYLAGIGIYLLTSEGLAQEAGAAKVGSESQTLVKAGGESASQSKDTNKNQTTGAKETPSGKKNTTADKGKSTEKNQYAVFETTLGRFKAKLYKDKEAELPVKNFIELVQGKKKLKSSESLSRQGKPYYDGIIFHRVIDGFMIQTGDPTGTGTGGSGNGFAVPKQVKLKHNKPGILSMANRGPGAPESNDSQFFVTVAATPWLDGLHPIFGEVVEGMEEVYKISKVKTVESRPINEVKINSLRIVEE